jgi:hypothetical protein
MEHRGRAGRNFCGSLACSVQLGSARLKFFTSWADILARFVNEPARELNELSRSSKTKLYTYYLRNN